MSDIIFPVDSGGNPYHTTEHYLRRVLPGDLPSVRGRMINALERLGYDILDDTDTIVRGRRGARGWGASYSSADVLDYPMTLVVKLKEHGPHATRATFDYVVKHPSLNKGERDILTREAEAISALATVRAVESVCITCGTESTDDSRFCRRCGTKLSVEVKELEVLRMSAEIRAGHTSIVTTFITTAGGFALTGAALLVLLTSGVTFGKGIGALLIIGLSLMFLSMFFVGFGWNRINRALKRKAPETELPGEAPLGVADPQAASFLSPPASVTERTTKFLTDKPDPAKTGEFLNEASDGLN